MKKFINILKIIIPVLILLCIVAWYVIIHLATVHLARPARRPLQDYHSAWLERPEQHGIKLEKRSFVDDRVPCLVVEPDANATLGKRGETIRKQLVDRGKVVLVEYGEVKAQVVILHGRNGRKEDLLPVAERFCAAGFRCLIPDLPGHGESPIAYAGFGGTDFEKDFVKKLDRESRLNTNYESLPSTIIGISMGGAYAIKTVEQTSGWQSMAIVCSFDSLEQVVEGQCNRKGMFLAPLLKSAVIKKAKRMTGLEVTTIRSINWAGKITTPIMVTHGIVDALIPIEHGQNLFNAFASEKKLWLEVPDGGHNNVLITKTQVFAPMAEWLLMHLDTY